MISSDQLIQGMTERQSEGVLASGSPVAITAGAGAGKTRVLTTRIAKIIRDGNPPESIVGMTFTSDASMEIKNRVIGIVGQVAGGKANISTIHSFAMWKVLCAHWNHPYLKKLGCVSKTFKLETSNLTLEQLKKSSKRNALSNAQVKHLDGLVEKSDNEFTSWLSLTRSFGYTPMTYFKDLDSPFTSLEELCRFPEKLTHEVSTFKDYVNHYFLKCWVQYDSLLREREVIDFDQVLVFAMMLLEHCATTRISIKKRFKYFLVDEFQDTNVCQYRFILALVGDGKNFSMFGDIKQAIYGFRGSSCYLMANIEQQFANIQIINLPDNFRSTDKVVAAGNKIAEHMGIQLVSEPMIAHKSSKIIPAMRQFVTENDEAHWVCDKILELKGKGIAPQDIGILYRFNKIGQSMENYLINRCISYRRLGNDKGLYEEPEIQNIVIFLHLIFHPYSPKALKFLFAMFTQFGVNQSIINEARKGLSKNSDGQVNSHQVLTNIMTNNQCKESTRPYLKKLVNLIVSLSGSCQRVNTFDDYCRAINEQYSNMADEHKESIEKTHGDKFWGARQDVIKQLTNHYVDSFLGLFGSTQSTSSDTTKELAEHNFTLIFNGSYEYSLSESNFLQYVCSRPLIDRVKKKKDDLNETDVELMTLHAAKGLEKKAIFIIGASEECWWRDPSIKNGTDAYEEEMRLFYVGLTRAIEHLTLTMAATREYNRAIQRCYPQRFSKLLDNTFEYHDHSQTPSRLVENAESFENVEV
ncbi:ATP-dependent helicase [Vibrio sp. R78045]|uniref:ATP-dependent helicase n=1 Tax=Vibrio sp. R78045 TaxID=3093868 RepID=UPI0036F2C147